MKRCKTTLALLVVGLGSTACARRTPPPSAPQPKLAFEPIGPVTPPVGYEIDAGSSRPRVAGVRTPEGRTLGATIKAYPPAVSTAEGAVYSRDFVLAKNLDADTAWRLIDPTKDLLNLAAASHGYPNGGRWVRTWAPEDPRALFAFGVMQGSDESLKDEPFRRVLYANLRLGEPEPGFPHSKEAQEIPPGSTAESAGAEIGYSTRWDGRAGSCGGPVRVVRAHSPKGDLVVRVEVGGRSAMVQPVVTDVPDGMPYISDPGDTTGADVDLLDATCCGGEPVWLEMSQRVDMSSADVRVSVNAPMALNVQGLRSGVLGYDVLSNLVGEAERIFLASYGIGCMNGLPVVAVTVGSVEKPAALWFAVPKAEAPTVNEPMPKPQQSQAYCARPPDAPPTLSTYDDAAVLTPP